MKDEQTTPAGDFGSTVGLGVMRQLPRGEVMASGIINGMRVELVRYTEEDILTRDRQWQYD